jgi:RNA polymerase sigma-70 factor (ECF subfamily)
MDTKRFEVELLALLPRLRAHAIALTGARSAGDDLLQDTLVRAWRFRDRFEEGSNMSAWIHKIMRNSFYSDAASQRRFVSDADGAHAAQLACEPDQEWCLKFAELIAALQRLSVTTREALLLVVAEDKSYEEAAEIADCPVGTMKSRVNRARKRLAELTEGDLLSVDPAAEVVRRQKIARVPMKVRRAAVGSVGLEVHI